MANTVTRGIRIPDEEWDPAAIVVARKHLTMTDIIRRAVRQEAIEHTFDAWVNREGKWWIIRIPDLGDAITQAHDNETIEMAKDLIAITLDCPIEQVKVRIRHGVP